MEGIELSAMLVALRQELQVAQQDAMGKEIKFVVNEVELELQLTVAKKAGMEGGVKFWVCNAKASGEYSSQSVQKIKLKLTPETADGKPLKVSDKDTRTK